MLASSPTASSIRCLPHDSVLLEGKIPASVYDGGLKPTLCPLVEVIPATHPGMETLRVAAETEGFRFLTRLVAEWNDGANRFDRPGELLVGAVRSERLLAVCGLNRDPFADRHDIGRLRHLYVHPSARRTGAGSALVGHLLGQAGGAFRVVRLRTTTAEAAAFYLRHGFVAVAEPDATHARAMPI
jgi:GNAT superfamily N-acetyltransferase